MARTILTTLLIAVLLNGLTGCGSVDSGRAQLIPASAKSPLRASSSAKLNNAGEADIVEQMVINRWAYRQSLESLIAYYKKTGNNMKLGWAKNEVSKLDQMPQYNYIVEAGLAGANLKATTSIPLADYMYQDALSTEKKAGRFILIQNEDKLRLALEKYNQLIRKHPSSDKIDDAAFRAGGIYEYFKDYTIALLYYQRAYQWDPKTTNPAKLKAAYILDKRMSRRAEALELYQQISEDGGLSEQRKELVESRIIELTKSGETLKENK